MKICFQERQRSGAWMNELRSQGMQGGRLKDPMLLAIAI